IAPMGLRREDDAPIDGLRCIGDPPTLAHWSAEDAVFRAALYAARSGPGPRLDDPQVLQWLGRFVGRLHAVGATERFTARRRIDAQTYGHHALERPGGGDALAASAA